MAVAKMSYFLFITIALLGGWLGTLLKLPAGGLVGSLLATALLNVTSWFETPPWPSEGRFLLQVGVGLLIGCSATADTLARLRDLWLPALVTTVLLVGCGLLTAWIDSRWLGLDQLTALLGSAPGGISGMSLAAIEMGAEASEVVVLHLSRLLTVLLILPWLVRLVVPPVTGGS